MFSRRADWGAAVNRFTEERQRRSGLIDLTISNPTAAGLPYPLDQLSQAMARGSLKSYDPQPLGLPGARQAVAQEIGCQPSEIVITASTSESYSFLFKLLCNPGDAILTATPSYPLLEHLAALENVDLQTFPLEFHRRWELHAERLRDAATARTRAIAVVNPNNPTGSYLRSGEQDGLLALGLPVVSDEVFFPYPLEGQGRSLAGHEVLTFTLGGLSKSAGLPHYKVGWIRVSGPGSEQAVAGLELIADNFLSVGSAVQEALPDLLRIGRTIRQAIQDRLRRNLDVLRGALPSSITLLPVEGGWSAVLRLPRTSGDVAMTLLDRGVAVQPGWFFDFPGEGFVVVSLLTAPELFDHGVARLTGY